MILLNLSVCTCMQILQFILKERCTVDNITAADSDTAVVFRSLVILLRFSKLETLTRFMI